MIVRLILGSMWPDRSDPGLDVAGNNPLLDVAESNPGLDVAGSDPGLDIGGSPSATSSLTPAFQFIRMAVHISLLYTCPDRQLRRHPYVPASTVHVSTHLFNFFKNLQTGLRTCPRTRTRTCTPTRLYACLNTQVSDPGLLVQSRARCGRERIPIPITAEGIAALALRRRAELPLEHAQGQATT